MALAHLPRCDRRFCLLCCCVFFLLNACGSVLNSPVSPTSTRNVTKLTTTPLLSSSAQGDCPANGTALPAVMPPLALGNHQNVVYSVDEYRGNEGEVKRPTFGTLKRYQK